jgi:hypothetical protein
MSFLIPSLYVFCPLLKFHGYYVGGVGGGARVKTVIIFKTVANVRIA